MSDMKYMDAGKSNQLPEEATTTYYPRFTVDLDQFPGLKCDVDECIDLHLKGRVCSVSHNDYSHSMDIKVTSIAVPSHTSESVGPKNEADMALGKLKGGKGIGGY